MEREEEEEEKQKKKTEKKRQQNYLRFNVHVMEICILVLQFLVEATYVESSLCTALIMFCLFCAAFSIRVFEWNKNRQD